LYQTENLPVKELKKKLSKLEKSDKRL